MCCLEEDLIDDEHTGDVVCMKCGRIKDTLYLPSFSNTTTYPLSSDSLLEEEINILTILNIPQLDYDIINRLRIKNQKVFSLRRNFVFALCVYVYCQKHDFYIPFKKMCYVFNLSNKQFTKILNSYYHQHNNVFKNHDYLKILETHNEMNLQFASLKEICAEAEASNVKDSFSPVTTCAAHYYLYLKSKKNCRISMKHISDIFFISHMSIYRYLKKYKDVVP